MKNLKKDLSNNFIMTLVQRIIALKIFLKKKMRFQKIYIILSILLKTRLISCDNNFLIIIIIILDEFIPRDHALKLAEKFKIDCERENLPGDQQAENSHSIYNYKPALELLCNSTNRVSEIIDEPVLPTYTYARVYKEGSVLKNTQIDLHVKYH